MKKYLAKVLVVVCVCFAGLQAASVFANPVFEGNVERIVWNESFDADPAPEVVADKFLQVYDEKVGLPEEFLSGGQKWGWLVEVRAGLACMVETLELSPEAYVACALNTVDTVLLCKGESLLTGAVVGPGCLDAISGAAQSCSKPVKDLSQALKTCL